MPQTTIADPTTLTCPKCEAPMEKVEFGRISVDRCPVCDGLWFDGDEHERLKGMTGAESIDVGSDREAAKTHRPPQEMHCPRCNGPMVMVQDAEQPHIEYEMCMEGHGVFFDAGEFRDFKEVTLAESIAGAWRRFVSKDE